MAKSAVVSKSKSKKSKVAGSNKNSWICSVVDLNTALDIVRKVNFKPVHPIYDMLYIRVSNDHMLLIHSDGQDYIKVVVPCQSNSIESDIVCGVSLSVFSKACAAKESISFFFSDDLSQLFVEGDLATLKLPVITDTDKFVITEIDSSLEAIILPPNSDLAKQVVAASEFVSLDTTKGSIQGIHLAHKDSDIVLAATDGHRLFYHESILNDPQFSIQGKWTVSARWASVLKDASTESFKLLFAPSYAYIEFFKSSIAVGLFTRLYDGSYPSIKALIPAEYTLSIEAKTTDLLAHLRLYLNTVSDSKFPVVTLDIDRDSDTLILKGNSEKGEFTSDDIAVLAEGSGDRLTISLNAFYLRDALETNIVEDTVKLQFNQANKPVVLCLQESSKVLLMPIMLRT